MCLLNTEYVYMCLFHYDVKKTYLYVYRKIFIHVSDTHTPKLNIPVFINIYMHRCLGRKTKHDGGEVVPGVIDPFLV